MTTTTEETPHADRVAPELRSKSVYTLLLERIRNGEIKPGERLTEVELAGQLNVSRTPVREALKQLQARHLLQAVPGRGLELVELSSRQVMELYDMRAVMEGMAAALAAECASTAAIDRMYRHAEYYRDNIDNPSVLAKANMQFHHAIIDEGTNDYLKDAIATLEDTLGLVRSRISNSRARRLTVADEHRAIVDAIARRDKAAAELIARHHIYQAKQYRLEVTLRT